MVWGVNLMGKFDVTKCDGRRLDLMLEFFILF
jgi:hypothetical protein